MYRGRHRAQRSGHQPWLPLTMAVLVGGLMLVSGTAAAEHDTVAEIEGCNKQFVDDEELVEIRWTSSLKDEPYGFKMNGRDGPIVSGTGDVLEVTVQWSVYQRESTTGAPWEAFEGTTESLRVDFRPPGFTPGGVHGDIVADLDHDPTPGDPSDCEVDKGADSYGSHTFGFTFDKLHKPLNRGGRDSPGEAKGNAELNVFVRIVGGPDLALGTNLHVVTDPFKG